MKIKKIKIRITDRKRFTCFCTILLLIVSIFTSILFPVLNAGALDKNKTNFSIQVQRGDTLWDIATQNNPNNKPTRQLVEEIIQYNKLASVTIQIGDTLIIPIS